MKVPTPIAVPSFAPAIPNKFSFSAGGSIDLFHGDDGASVTIESAEDKVTFSGNLDITRDLHGLALAQAMMTVLQDCIAVLKEDMAAGHLPEFIAIEKPTIRENPFS